MRILPSRSAPALLSAPESRVMARRNRFRAPSSLRSYPKVCIPSAQIRHLFQGLAANRCASQRVLYSRNGACHPPRTPDSRVVTTRRSCALSLSPNHTPHAPSTPKRVSTSREAPSAELHRPSGLVEFWREEDARRGEEALHCAEIEGQNIAVQLYNRRGSGVLSEFSPRAPPFVPSGSAYPTPYPTQVSFQSPNRRRLSHSSISIRPQERAHTILAHPYRSFTAQASRFNSHPFMVQDRTVTAASSILATCSARCALPSFLPTIARPCPSES